MNNCSYKLNQFVIGCILGDGYITKNGSLQIDHSLKQKEYVHFKYAFLKSYNVAGKAPKIVYCYDKRTNKTYQSIRFYTKCHFQQLRSIFYATGKKEVPKDIQKYLNSPLALAI